MSNYKIKCEAVKVVADRFKCSRVGQTFILGPRTPEGMCARAFAAVYPVAVAMRFSDSIPWEREGEFVDVACPDADVIYRLSRIREPQ